MSRFISLTAAILLLCPIKAYAGGHEEQISFSALPESAQKFCKKHFEHLTIAYIVKETKIMRVEYEVKFTDRTEIDFRGDGSWESVECKSTSVPSSIVPGQIAEFLANNGYADLFIKKIERSPYIWEIEMSNNLEIKFDTKFNVIGYDD